MESLKFLYKMDVALLNWLGNLLNFLILIYLVLNVINTSCFKPSEILISAFGLMVSILIQLRSLVR